MLRNRSRAMTKQPIMADQTSKTSPPIHNQTRPISPFFASPRFFTAFLTKGLSNNEPILSPTSILESTKFSNFGNQFGLEKTLPKNPTKIVKKLELGIVAALTEEKTSDYIYKPKPRSTLKIQIPPPPFRGDFGIKTPKNHEFYPFSLANPCVETKSDEEDFALVSTGPLSLSEMEMSEEYTCVITHGPNPKTTHIFGNCVVKSCSDVETMAPELETNDRPKPSFNNFLSYCHTCNKDLGEEDDIFMYRGEKAFCSEECRGQEMILDWEC